MSANVETMFYTGRKAPWHGLGTQVEYAPDSKRALELSGLDWKVVQEPVYDCNNIKVPGYRLNIRDTDRQVLGIVSERYQVVQNNEAFDFTDELLRNGVVYETAGSLAEGRQCWILARMPNRYFQDDEITPYLLFSNSHDGSGAIRVAITPVRVVCQNTLNLALNTAKRSWSARHTGNIHDRMQEARETLGLAERYMVEWDKSLTELGDIMLSDRQVNKMIRELYPIDADMNDLKIKRNKKLQEELKERYYNAPDLVNVGKNGYRFINAVSDMATHSKPLRMTKNYNENRFKKVFEGYGMIDKAYAMLQAA